MIGEDDSKDSFLFLFSFLSPILKKEIQKS